MERDQFIEAVLSLNKNLGLLAILGSGPPEAEFETIIETSISEIRDPLRDIREAYETKKKRLFELNNVLKHGHCCGRSWHEIVIRNCEEFVEGVRLISVRHALKILHDGGYDAERVALHLAIECEAAAPDGCDEVDSDFTEPLPKEFVAHMFRKSTDWLREQIDNGAIRVHSETARTARKAKFQIDTVPMLKHAHERKRLLLEYEERKKKSRRKAD